MQSLRTADSQTQNASVVHPAGNVRLLRRAVFPTTVLIAIGIGCCYVAFVYPRPITRYDEIKTYIGKRVTFITIVDRQYKAYELVYLDDKPIIFSHTPGGIDWSPERGEVCRVVGLLEHEPTSMWGIPYRLSRAEYFPLRVSSEHVTEN
jgi:hypothetical protein